jgi:hemoglobin/transferrin/lactoferrin receptor protein
MRLHLQIIAILCSLICVFGLQSQTLEVVDYATKKPISGVHIYTIDEKKSTITDSLGTCDISLFQNEDLLVFSHTSYVQVLFKKQDLYTSRYKLSLHPTILNLDEFVISANKRIQAKEEVPNKLVSITAKDIRLNDPQTSADLIASSGEVFVQKSQMGGGSPMIRGFSANKVLIVVDGVRMNNAIFRGGNLQNVISIDPNIVEKSEIVFGPGSVIYGSDALGGVIDFQTLSTSYSDTGKFLKGNVLARYSSANNELTPHIDFSFGSKKFSSVSSISYSQFSDLKMGTNGPEEYLRNDYVKTYDGVDKMVENENNLEQKFTGYSAYSIMQKFGYKFSERINLSYSFIYSNTSDIPRYDRLIQRKNEETLKYARWDYGPQKWMINNLSLNVNAPNGAFDNLRITLAMQNFEESRISRKFGKLAEKFQKENVDMYSANFDFDNALSGRSILYYGVEFVYNSVNSEAVSKENGAATSIMTRYPDNSKYMSNAAYINFQVNHSRKTTFVFGLRYNQILIDAILDTTFYKSQDSYIINQNTGALTGSLGLAHRPSDSWQMNLNFSSGFKAPNIDDIAKVFDSQLGNVIVPNPGLKPEYLYSMDGLLSKTVGSNRKYKFELSGFYSFLVDAMVQREFQINGQDSIIYDGELSQVQAIVNTGSAKITGVSMNVTGDVNKVLKWKGHFTYTYGKDDEGNNLRHVTPVFANAHLIYTKKRVRLDGYINYNGSIANSKMAPSELLKPDLYIQDENGGLYTPSWYTLNFKSAVDISNKLLFTLGIENITNQRYRAYSSGIASPSINFIASLKATF